MYWEKEITDFWLENKSSRMPSKFFFAYVDRYVCMFSEMAFLVLFIIIPWRNATLATTSSIWDRSANVPYERSLTSIESSPESCADSPCVSYSISSFSSQHFCARESIYETFN